MLSLFVGGRPQSAGTVISPYAAGWNGDDGSLTFTKVDPYDSVTKTLEFAVWRGANVDDGTPAKIVLWCHGANESGFDISVPLNAAGQLPKDLIDNTGTVRTFFADCYIIVPQQPSLDGPNESTPSKDLNNTYRVSAFEYTLDLVLSQVNADMAQIHVLGFSGGGNWVTSLIYRRPGFFASGTTAEGNMEAAKQALDSSITTDAMFDLFFTLLPTTNTAYWQHQNANDSNVQPDGTPGTAGRWEASWGGAPFTSPFSTAPSYTSGRYTFTNGRYQYEERSTGGYAPIISGSGTGTGGHDGSGLWRDEPWQTWFAAQGL